MKYPIGTHIVFKDNVFGRYEKHIEAYDITNMGEAKYRVSDSRYFPPSVCSEQELANEIEKSSSDVVDIRLPSKRLKRKQLHALLSEAIELINSEYDGFMEFNCLETLKEVRKQLCEEEEE